MTVLSVFHRAEQVPSAGAVLSGGVGGEVGHLTNTRRPLPLNWMLDKCSEMVNNMVSLDCQINLNPIRSTP